MTIKKDVAKGKRYKIKCYVVITETYKKIHHAKQKTEKITTIEDNT
jgi:hypothetical protein